MTTESTCSQFVDCLKVEVGFTFDNNDDHMSQQRKMSLVPPPVVDQSALQFRISRWLVNNITVSVSICPHVAL